MENIILIGMPGAGKSTVGVVLAKILGFSFLDSDLLIQQEEGKLLYELIDLYKIEGFLKIEDRINANIETKRCVIATGGSAIYGKKAMEHFQKNGILIYLELSYESLKKRLGDLNKRGVTLKKDQSLKELYKERIPLYEKYANVTIHCDQKPIREIAQEIAFIYKEYKGGRRKNSE
jgi:shikimate kinase